MQEAKPRDAPLPTELVSVLHKLPVGQQHETPVIAEAITASGGDLDDAVAQGQLSAETGAQIHALDRGKYTPKRRAGACGCGQQRPCKRRPTSILSPQL